jgi:hypothetical protein
MKKKVRLLQPCSLGVSLRLSQYIATQHKPQTNILQHTTQQSAVGVDPKSLITTINFINFKLGHVVNHQDYQIKSWIKKWDTDKKTQALARNFPAAVEVIRTLASLAAKDNQTSKFVIGCSTLHSVAEYQKLVDVVNFPTFTDEQVGSGESSFIYSHLRKIAAEEEKVMTTVLTLIVNQMLSLPQQMKANPKVAETTLLALFHMLRNFIATGPNRNTGFLQRAVQTIQQFYLWPQPYGQVSRGLLQLLQHEIASAGAALRASAVEDAVSATWTDLDENKKSVTRPAVFYVTDAKDPRSQSYSQILVLQQLATPSNFVTARARPSNKGSAALSPLKQALFLLNSMKHACTGGLAANTLENMMRLSATGIAQLYVEFEAINANCRKSNSPANILATGMTKLQNLVVSKLNVKGDEVEWPDELPEDFVPTRAEMKHLNINVDFSRETAYKLLTTTEEKKMGLKAGAMSFPHTPSYELLKKILGMYQNTGDAMTHVRLCCAGGDAVLHNVLCAYMQIHQSNPQLLESVQVHFYLVPLQENHFAAYIARHDSWYNRHIFVPFRLDPFLVPWIAVDDSTKQKGEEKVNPPGQFLRSCIESYISEGKQSFDTTVWCVQGWKIGTSTKPDALIPFVQRLAIGANAAIEEVKQANNLPHATVKEVKKNKQYDYSALELGVKFVKSSMTGEVMHLVKDEPCTYTNLSLSHVPHIEDACVPPHPTHTWLELHGEPDKSARKKFTKNHLVANNTQHICSMELQAVKGKAYNSGRFHVLIDGVSFGPYERIKVSPCVNSGGPADIMAPDQPVYTHISKKHKKKHKKNKSEAKSHGSSTKSKKNKASVVSNHVTIRVNAFFPLHH